MIYRGSSKITFNDFYGYNAFISYDDFINGNPKVYIKIKNDEIELNFIEEFVNDNFIYGKKTKISEPPIYKKNIIPSKIKELFICDDNSCSLTTKDESILFVNNFFVVEGKDFYIMYDLDNKVFGYTKNEGQNVVCDFAMLSDETVLCNIGNCSDAKKIFSDFQQNYIMKYLI